MRKILIFALCAAMLAGCTKDRTDNTAGTDIPSMDSTGYQEYLEGAAGKVVVVNVFASWCPPCEMETPDFVSLYNEKNRNFELLGLSIDDSAADLAAFMKKHKVTYPVYIIDKRLQRRLMADKVPMTFIYTPAGELHDMRLGQVSKNELRMLVERAK